MGHHDTMYITSYPEAELSYSKVYGSVNERQFAFEKIHLEIIKTRRKWKRKRKEKVTESYMTSRTDTGFSEKLLFTLLVT